MARKLPRKARVPKKNATHSKGLDGDSSARSSSGETQHERAQRKKQQNTQQQQQQHLTAQKLRRAPRWHEPTWVRVLVSLAALFAAHRTYRYFVPSYPVCRTSHFTYHLGPPLLLPTSANATSDDPAAALSPAALWRAQLTPLPFETHPSADAPTRSTEARIHTPSAQTDGTAANSRSATEPLRVHRASLYLRPASENVSELRILLRGRSQPAVNAHELETHLQALTARWPTAHCEVDPQPDASGRLHFEVRLVDAALFPPALSLFAGLAADQCASLWPHTPFLELDLVEEQQQQHKIHLSSQQQSARLTLVASVHAPRDTLLGLHQQLRKYGLVPACSSRTDPQHQSTAATSSFFGRRQPPLETVLEVVPSPAAAARGQTWDGPLGTLNKLNLLLSRTLTVGSDPCVAEARSPDGAGSVLPVKPELVCTDRRERALLQRTAKLVGEVSSLQAETDRLLLVVQPHYSAENPSLVEQLFAAKLVRWAKPGELSSLAAPHESY